MVYRTIAMVSFWLFSRCLLDIAYDHKLSRITPIAYIQNTYIRVQTNQSPIINIIMIFDRFKLATSSRLLFPQTRQPLWRQLAFLPTPLTMFPSAYFSLDRTSRMGQTMGAPQYWSLASHTGQSRTHRSPQPPIYICVCVCIIYGSL